MAAGSVEPREVITETMAEVLVKQGNIEKAVDLYRKLSLAHPDKSTYFAARIEQLKHR
jgi:pentatricopeptide repeat protein